MIYHGGDGGRQTISRPLTAIQPDQQINRRGQTGDSPDNAAGCFLPSDMPPQPSADQRADHQGQDGNDIEHGRAFQKIGRAQGKFDHVTGTCPNRVRRAYLHFRTGQAAPAPAAPIGVTAAAAAFAVCLHARHPARFGIDDNTYLFSHDFVPFISINIIHWCQGVQPITNLHLFALLRAISKGLVAAVRVAAALTR